MRFWPRRKATRTIAATLAAVVMVGGGIAVGTSIANAAVSEKEAGQLQVVHFLSDGAVRDFTTSSWVDLVDWTVPGGDWVRMVRVRLGASTSCARPGDVSGGHCTVQVVVDNTMAVPATGYHFEFASASSASDDGGIVQEQRSMERARTYNSGSGDTIRVRIQAQVRNGATKFTFDDWTVSIELFS
jgi:hypothetical protein